MCGGVHSWAGGSSSVMIFHSFHRDPLSTSDMALGWDMALCSHGYVPMGGIHTNQSNTHFDLKNKAGEG